MASMIARAAALSALVLGLAAGTAGAQQAALVEVDDSVALPGWNLTVDQAEDANVAIEDGRRVAEIEEIVGPDRNTPTGVVLDFDDGANYGNRDEVLVPIENFRKDGEIVVLTSSAADVAGFPTYDD